MAANVFPILEDKLGVCKVRTELPELFNIEYVITYDIYIHMQGNCFVSVFQAIRDKRIRSLPFTVEYPVYKITPPLEHPLIDEFLEWLLFGHIPHILEEFIPEPAI